MIWRGFGIKVAPALKAAGEEGLVYILDRAGDSTTAYQGFGLYDGNEKIINFIFIQRYGIC